jgi:hypothetical protein
MRDNGGNCRQAAVVGAYSAPARAGSRCSDLCAAVISLSLRGMPLAVLVPRCDAAGSFGSTLRRVPHAIHRRDTFFGTNWNIEQTKYERGDQPSHA